LGQERRPAGRADRRRGAGAPRCDCAAQPAAGGGSPSMIDAPRHDPASARQPRLPARSPLSDRSYWLIACCVVLVGLAFASHPGQILADTKIDLAINPAGFLQRALHLWDPAQFGQLQNQAVGYFFPIGPFFLLGKLAALPGWITQRLW